MTSGVQGIALVRRFGPSGLSFNPPLEVTIHYDAREVEGIPEDELQVVIPSAEAGTAQVLDVLGRDLAVNTITVALPSFPASPDEKVGEGQCSLVMGNLLDSDCDGARDLQDSFPADSEYQLDADGDEIADEWETFWFGPLMQPEEDPLELCGPEGDPDADGISNLDEFRRRALALNPLQAEVLPVCGVACLILAAAAVIVLACVAELPRASWR